MSTVTVPADARSAATATGPYRLSFPRVLRSEVIKLTTLRSTWISILIVAVLTIGIAILIAFAIGRPESGDPLPLAAAVTMPTQFTALFAAALGAIAITGEYGTGMIRSTLTAQPRRGAVLAAKAIVVAGFVLVASLLIYLAAAAAVWFVLGADSVDMSDPHRSLLPLLYAAVSMAVCALIGLSAGFLLRNGAGAIGVAVGLMFVLPIVAQFFVVAGPSWEWVVTAADYLPLNAAAGFTLPDPGDAGAWIGAGVTLAAWTAAGLLGSWAVLRGRDA